MGHGGPEKQFTLSSKTNKGLSSGWWTARRLQSRPACRRVGAHAVGAGGGEGGTGHRAYPDALGTAHVVGRQGALSGQHTLLMLRLQVQLLRVRLLLQRRWGLRGQLREREGGLLWLVQPVRSRGFSLIELLLGGKMQQVLKSQEPGVISLPRLTSMQGLRTAALCFKWLAS